jgi:23S rRNA (cytidine1920-2'-O)/16S rRNA (cytidine1409-2'-O)-methyltransferase
VNQRGSRVRADELLVKQGLVESRAKAKALIVAGDVRSGDRAIDKPSELLDPETVLELRDKLPFVSRGGLKLAHALTEFRIDVTGQVAADLGASTGGFTDVLLQRDALRVYAIDVGYGQLDYRLRTDPRVVVMERVNARHLDGLPEAVEFVCIDVSFISLEHILPVAARLLGERGQVVALIKPQFEAGRDLVGKGGVVRDERVRQQTVERSIGYAAASELGFAGLTRSPITGPAGNVEFLAHFVRGDAVADEDATLKSVFGASRG